MESEEATHIEPMLIGTSEVMKLLSIKKSLFYEANATGRLPCPVVQINSKKLWSVEELKLWIRCGCPSREKWQSIRQNEMSKEQIRGSNVLWL